MCLWRCDTMFWFGVEFVSGLAMLSVPDVLTRLMC